MLGATTQNLVVTATGAKDLCTCIHGCNPHYFLYLSVIIQKTFCHKEFLVTNLCLVLFYQVQPDDMHMLV
jgi:hypothetical protein